jgi:MAF protein
MQLVLASSSPYRRALLERLRLPFHCASPAIDETPQPGEAVQALVCRLALAKAQALAGAWPASLIIGCDQACLLGERILGKPGNYENAFAQLRACSGHEVQFCTALVLYDSATGSWQECLDTFSVRFRDLPDAEIAYYLQQDQPFDCAGSFKVEGLGISLFDSMAGKDYHSLIGLPLLSLCELLRQAGLNPLAPFPDAAVAAD